jgi:hypothetical protein
MRESEDGWVRHRWRRECRRGRGPALGPGELRRPVGEAGLRSLPAKQHAPTACPATHYYQWPADGAAGRAVNDDDVATVRGSSAFL